MAEESMIGYVRKGLKRRALVLKHNDINPGIADLSLYFPKWDLTRWVELKALPDWPTRAGTRIWWPHYTESQALFLRQRRGFLLVRCGRRTYALFSGGEAWAMWEARGWPKAEFLRRAARVWPGGIVWAEFEREVL